MSEDNTTPDMSTPDDFVVASLKKRYFDIALKEKFGSTPEITTELDNLELAIKNLSTDERRSSNETGADVPHETETKER